MGRASAFLALLILAAFFTACGQADSTNNSVNTNSTPKQTHKVTVTHPNLFLQDDDSDRGKVSFELVQVSGDVFSTTTSNGNTTTRVDKIAKILPVADTDKYDVYVKVQLIPIGLTKTDLSSLEKPYTGERVLWEWNLKPEEGLAEGAKVSFQFRVDVAWKAKTSDVDSEDYSNVWKNDFSAEVGQPAWKVDMAFYGSSFMGVGGVFVSVKGIRRRKTLLGAESEEEDIEDQPRMAGKEVELEEEEVSSTVYAPKQDRPGNSFLVQVFVHLPEQADSLDNIAKEADEDAKRLITNKLRKKIKRGTELTFYLQMPGLDIDDPAQSCVWTGEPAWVQFGVTVPEDCKPKSIIGTVTVSEASVPIGHLKFKFKITGEADVTSEVVPAGNMIRYRQAFISYASPDRTEVLKRVQMLNLAKIKFFQDLLDLEPGDSWEKLLYDYIDKSDVFFLFWSKAASESEWVKKEVEYAIKRKSGQEESSPEIIPVIIEGPPPAEPPVELSRLHFNDKLLYFINPRETEAKPLDG